MAQGSAAKEVIMFAKKSKSNVVMVMMDVPLKDLDEEKTIVTAKKTGAPADYEPFMKDSAEKWSEDPESMKLGEFFTSGSGAMHF